MPIRQCSNRAGWIRTSFSRKRAAPNLAPFKALELPHRPSYERQIDVSEHGLQCRAVEPPVIPDPPPKEWIEHTGDVIRDERWVCCRIFKSRTVDRMAFSAEGLTAG